MTYVVTENCIKCKYTDCVEVCPVNCFYEGPDMLVIQPEECIDCGVCEPECPADAIKPERTELMWWVELNRRLAREGRPINCKKPPPADAGSWCGVSGKYELVFGNALDGPSDPQG